ncbi:epoxide hydrolase [Georgenia sp. 311]|uniref:epoxide hydrolase family protein n=1 Tax=Georgenia sp. 311 TaxID=2585134 RepID=UPI001112507B|nr:epoxide hydrolase family protein [Georgenia sp. 311]TNC19718.1 epoxide hydrolase [Georgenia sp. 311]
MVEQAPVTGDLPGLRPFRVAVPEAELADLRDRLRRTRWPEAAPAPGWEQGIPLEVVQRLCRRWAEGYDWRATEARLDAVPQYLVTVDGLDLHLLHARSPHPGAFPLVLTHGWPGSVLELLSLVGPLTDPPAHGGRAEDAFDVVIPSLPGYGFSGRPTTRGWGIERVARAWARLMALLGYDRYGAAGSDWGTSVSATLGVLDPARVAGVHLVPPLAGPRPDGGPPSPEERAALAELAQRGRESSAYSEVHRTAPQTVGYALTDSPAGLCAWLGEKLLAWTGPPGLTDDQVLDQVSLYWFTRTAASSARLYAESIGQVAGWLGGQDEPVVRVPAGASVFGAEVPRPSRRWAERRFPDLRYWAEHERGGHFPALEVPELFVEDLRAFYRHVR